jgi:hypothetical protein
MQCELAVGATVRRGIEGVFFGAKAEAGARNTRLGRLVFGLLAIRAEPPAEAWLVRGAHARFGPVGSEMPRL